MKAVTISRYANDADARERDPIVIPGEHGRADVASGRMSKWARFNRVEDLVWVDDADGRPVALTRKQLSTLHAIRRLAGTGQRVTMRSLAGHLQLAPSSVSRTAVKLAAFGFIAYQSNRGRYGGTVFVLRQTYDTLEWFREQAKAKVRAWAKAAQARVSRLRANVASYHPMRTADLIPSTRYLERNIRTGWSVDELRDVGIV